MKFTLFTLIFLIESTRRCDLLNSIEPALICNEACLAYFWMVIYHATRSINTRVGAFLTMQFTLSRINTSHLVCKHSERLVLSLSPTVVSSRSDSDLSVHGLSDSQIHTRDIEFKVISYVNNFAIWRQQL